MFQTKRLFPTTLLLTFIVALNARLITESTFIQLTPQNSVFATDLDDVILKSDRTAESIQSSGSIKSYLWNSNWHSLLKGWSNFKRINGERKYIEWIKTGKTDAAQFIRNVSQQKKIMPDTLELYKKLNEQGFQLYTATNIGSIFFSDIQKKFPEVFNDNFIKHSMTVDYSVKDPIEKPDLRYFEILKAKINPVGDKYILFIDDRKENVEAARKAGLLAIQFKNAKQLEEDLKNLYGITL